jgi:hypothetical protein
MKWYKILITPSIMTSIAFIVCLFLESDLWIWFGIGSFAATFKDILKNNK